MGRPLDAIARRDVEARFNRITGNKVRSLPVEP